MPGMPVAAYGWADDRPDAPRFYVLEGVLTMRLGDETREAPSGLEHYMRKFGAAAKAGPLTPEVMRPIASRYDFERA